MRWPWPGAGSRGLHEERPGLPCARHGRFHQVRTAPPQGRADPSSDAAGTSGEAYIRKDEIPVRTEGKNSVRNRRLAVWLQPKVNTPHGLRVYSHHWTTLLTKNMSPKKSRRIKAQPISITKHRLPRATTFSAGAYALGLSEWRRKLEKKQKKAWNVPTYGLTGSKGRSFWVQH